MSTSPRATAIPEQPVRTAVTTYRYLRLALVILVVLLFAAVVVEWWHTDPTCLQTSISAYYYTPARPVLVGTLVAVGVALIALKGGDDREDVLLNLAGMMAPVVAFVPTPDHGSCSSIVVPPTDTAAYVGNNVVALFLAGALAVGLTVLAVARLRRPTTAQRVGTAVSVVALVVGIAWFALDRGGFGSYAHYAAATSLFLLFVAVVWLNARDVERRRGHRVQGVVLGLRTRYAPIAIGMVVIPLALGLLYLLTGWEHLLLVVETALIGLFAAFWVLQTVELGDLTSRA